ncbi:hypothetical protein RCL1_008017 [Eukaryota sp. TZLM3-RCL]
MYRFLFFSVFIAIALAACLCPGQCGWGYWGSDAQCFCWCGNTAASLKLGSNARCSYFPRATFSTGGCSLCSTGIKSDVESFYSLYSAEELTDAVESEAIVVGSGTIFPVKRCHCPGLCGSGYFGSYDQCLSYAKSIASQFIGGKYTVTYFPRSTFSTGGCSVCGNVDSCSL